MSFPVSFRFSFFSFFFFFLTCGKAIGARERERERDRERICHENFVALLSLAEQIYIRKMKVVCRTCDD